jgi:hypothetical protein
MKYLNTLRNRGQRRSVCVFLLSLGVLFWPNRALAEHPEDILIIANKAISANDVTINEMKSIFLGRKAALGRQGKVTPVHAKEGSKLRVEFQRRVLDMGPEEEISYWEDQKIRSGATKPPEFTRPIKAVFSRRDSVGYVFRKDYQDGVVRILLVLPASP